MPGRNESERETIAVSSEAFIYFLIKVTKCWKPAYWIRYSPEWIFLMRHSCAVSDLRTCRSKERNIQGTSCSWKWNCYGALWDRCCLRISYRRAWKIFLRPSNAPCGIIYLWIISKLKYSKSSYKVYFLFLKAWILFMNYLDVK